MEDKTIDELAVQERKTYFKEWRKRNRDKVRQHNQNYWRRRVENKLRTEQGGKEE